MVEEDDAGAVDDCLESRGVIKEPEAPEIGRASCRERVL